VTATQQEGVECAKKTKTLVKLDGTAESVVFLCTLEGVIPDITLSNHTTASH
jgi:hypothetical protein